MRFRKTINLQFINRNKKQVKAIGNINKFSCRNNSYVTSQSIFKINAVRVMRISVLFLFLFLSTTAFAHTATIENSGENKYKAIRITPEIYNNANHDLSDLRIKDNSGEDIPFFINSGGGTKTDTSVQRYTMAMSTYNFFTQEKTYFVESITPRFSTKEKDKNTYINIEGLKNLRLGEITISTESMFKRTVSSPFGISKELYNLTFSNTSYTDTSMSFDWQTSNDDVFVLSINNGDDKPISINKITVKYYADELVFEGSKSEKYTIYFGAGDTKAAPVYDIERYKNEILADNIDRLSIKEVVLDKSKEEPEPKTEAEPYDYRMIFNIAVIAAAVVLGVLILLKLRKKA